MTVHHIAIVGSGTLAMSVCSHLAALPPASETPPLRVTVLARNLVAATAVAEDCGRRAAAAGCEVLFAAEAMADGDSPAADEAMLSRLRPDTVVCCASAQSPYEKAARPSAWTELVRTAGFGVTLALQSVLAARLARTMAQAAPNALLINGCFPDAVNPLLASLDLPVHCGLGNVATLAACLRTALDLPGEERLSVLGHHAHLDPPGPSGNDVRAWRRGAPVAGVTELLAADRARPRRELNDIAGSAAARLLAAIASGAEIHTSLPGPLGLPGGYPVRVTGSDLAIDLPSGLALADAVQWNRLAGHRDGVDVHDGYARHTPRAAEALGRHLPDLAEGWPTGAYAEVADLLTDLRARLRDIAPSAA